MENYCPKCGKPISQCICASRANPAQPPRAAQNGFSFGTQQPQSRPQPQQQNNGFQFGASQSQPAGGFSFGAQQPQQQQPRSAQPQPQQQPRSAQPQRAGSFCTKCGKPLTECTCNQVRIPLPTTSAPKDRMTLKDFFGFTESDKNVDADYMENGKRIVPDVLSKCEGEIPVKQFVIGKARKRLSLSWGYSRIQVTNKRLIQRTVGRSIIGKDVDHTEMAIDEICGITYSRGKQFSFGDFLIMLLMMLVPLVIGFGIGQIGEAMGYIVSILVILGVGYFRFFQKVSVNGIYALANALSVGTWLGALKGMDFFYYMDLEDLSVPALLYLITFIAMIVYWIRYSILPSVTLTARTKSMNNAAAGIINFRRLAKISAPSIFLPAEETEQAVKELNAIITDVQKLGDYAIEKWSDQPGRAKPGAPRQPMQ